MDAKCRRNKTLWIGRYEATRSCYNPLFGTKSVIRQIYGSLRSRLPRRMLLAVKRNVEFAHRRIEPLSLDAAVPQKHFHGRVTDDRPDRFGIYPE